MPGTLTVDKQGYIYADGVKIGRVYHERDTIQFCDKNPCRSSLRGSRFVEVPINNLIEFLSGRLIKPEN
jgi:hypothetical protein